ncbi:hypothetical protein EB118_13470 [bacterium]|nr:hypothetical protein [bacterium]NDC94599.1 hypothetical protein [bacterium]NDD84825.1 hypothetical protein [bacterium]NDG31062.1 hypothetical protein [bacterium]
MDLEGIQNQIETLQNNVLVKFFQRETVRFDEIADMVPASMRKAEFTIHDLLAVVNKLSKSHHYEKSIRLLEIIQIMKCNKKNKFLDELFDLGMYAHYKRKELYELEAGMYEPIIEYIGELIPNAQRNYTETPRDCGLRPDLFFSVNGKLCVGEVSCRNVSSNNVKKLRKYMCAFGCPKGYAFGETNSCKLDENMEFICIKGLKDRYYKKPLSNL